MLSLDDWCEAERARLVNSGWAKIPQISKHIGINPADWLDNQDHSWWNLVRNKAGLLETWLNKRRFGNDTEVGLLYVPAIDFLDTRKSIEESVRKFQRSDLGKDIFDQSLDVGIDLVPDGFKGSFFVSCLGKYGVSVGSYDHIHQSSTDDFMVAGTDLRSSMTRQLWGARVLQAGDNFLPDAEGNDKWTFTLFAAENLIDGQAQSGTILKSHVRFRLGKANRSIGSARVAPSIFIEAV